MARNGHPSLLTSERANGQFKITRKMCKYKQLNTEGLTICWAATVREKSGKNNFFKVRKKSGNFVKGQGKS